eukprot:145414-Prymnesium_polylepis.1
MRLIVAWRRAARPAWASCVSFFHVAWVRLGGVLALIVFVSWMIAESALWLCRHLRKGFAQGWCFSCLGRSMLRGDNLGMIHGCDHRAERRGVRCSAVRGWLECCSC